MCGIVGVYNIPEASRLAVHALQRLQHRGQEAAGAASSDGRRLSRHRGSGDVTGVFGGINFASELPGMSAISHVRYSTAGKDGLITRDRGSRRGIQPLLDDSRYCPAAFAHNGNIPEAKEICLAMERTGTIFASMSDTELFMHLAKQSDAPDFSQRLIDGFKQIDGAYALLVLTLDRLYAAVDPHGFRPLCWAPYRGGFLIASETCALDLFDIPPETVVQVEPGTLLEFANGLTEPRVTRFAAAPFRRFCSFEWIYFARPDSTFDGQSVSKVREDLGRRLARCCPAVGADMVIAVPDSANVHAAGFSQESGLPLGNGLVRSHSVGRTFIDPGEEKRAAAVRLKLNPDRGVVAGKKLVVIDDSIVRGNTTKEIIALLRRAGALEIHLRIASPEITDSCFWGIDTPEKEKLIAATRTKDEIAAFVGADSLEYLPIEELRQALNDPEGKRHCLTCFNGIHPTKS